MIITNIEHLRDPFVLVENGCYYAYGTGIQKNEHADWDNTGWACYKNDSGCLDGPWKRTDRPVYLRPEHAEKNFWAPEVHKYQDKYYMFATYFSSLTKRKGCSILSSESPEGPFVEITGGHITPAEWDSIDGTFYVDGDGQPWMVFVHEWACLDDKVGRMAATKLSEDLTHFISEPLELFRADEPSWATGGITDGCFLYETADGRLLMLWSNFCSDGYCVGIAESKNSRVDGEWIQQEELLFSKQTIGQYDGGHGMIFTDFDGQKYLSVHSPNRATEQLGERTIFLPVCEKNGTLVCITES